MVRKASLTTWKYLEPCGQYLNVLKPVRFLYSRKWENSSSIYPINFLNTFTLDSGTVPRVTLSGNVWLKVRRMLKESYNCKFTKDMYVFVLSRKIMNFQIDRGLRCRGGLILIWHERVHIFLGGGGDHGADRTLLTFCFDLVVSHTKLWFTVLHLAF